MKFVFVFLGKTAEGYLDSGIKDYAQRLARLVQVEIVVLRDKVPRSLPRSQFMRKEAELLLHACRDTSCLVALDAGGRTIDSVSLASVISDWEERGLKTVHFVIGGHLGLHQQVLEKANFTLSLSKMTFTHEMVRLLLLEQLYRGCMIKSGRRYHN
ncbi:MAG: 23S rRNA (pseudouridine(1915)-N(3))-methyltransferase RlmH [Candidatus Marinimicrobia bacterium]|nr:23S rRNA (pseudouridine(1915)-N(3))-methyltransferase RlmH [Candidatus Neomarinimicrobiota bacterium]